jgi:hypothetical protein
VTVHRDGPGGERIADRPEHKRGRHPQRRIARGEGESSFYHKHKHGWFVLARVADPMLHAASAWTHAHAHTFQCVCPSMHLPWHLVAWHIFDGPLRAPRVFPAFRQAFRFVPAGVHYIILLLRFFYF